ncbi:Mce protein [Mycolicibacter minnesotensis]
MEGDAGAVPLTTDEDQQTADTSAEHGAADAELEVPAPTADPASTEAVEPPPSRLGRGLQVGICVLLLLLAAGLVAAGFAGQRDHAASQALERENAEAIAAAKECVLATQAPDGRDMALAQQKILNCTAGEFRTQVALYAEMFVHAYQAAKVHVELTEMGAAIERNNPDGSVDIMVAFRVKIDNIETQGKEVGYRLRAQMVREDGQYRIARLDQVAR